MENKVKKFSDLVNSLEQISEDQHGMLVGGFTSIGSVNTSFAREGNNFLACSPTTNNCSGGNCVSGCGTVE